MANTPGYHISDDGFVYSDQCSVEHIAELRKQIDRKFHSPLHIARVILKLLRAAHWRVKAKAALTIPVFLAVLFATQVDRKTRQTAPQTDGLENWWGSLHSTHPTRLLLSAIRRPRGCRLLQIGRRSL